MSTFKLSTKLTNYLDKITNETGRQIIIEETENLGISGMSAGFVDHPSHIVVLIAKGRKMTDPTVEQSIAHEATHGYLIYKKRYCKWTLRRPADDKEINCVTVLFTMIDDIVVNKIIHEESFPPYHPKYLSVVESETKIPPIERKQKAGGIHLGFPQDLIHLPP